MKNKIWILFDCPDESNDKKWLIEELHKLHNGNVYSVPIHKTLCNLFVGNVFQKIYGHLIILWQCVRTLIHSSKDDVIIAWNPRNGRYLNAMLRFLNRKNRLISMNWLTPTHQMLRSKRTLKWVLENPHAKVIVNSPESVSEWNECLGVNSSNISVIPDVYDSDTAFYKRDSWERYCFTGGFNNRDWNVVRKLALQFPNMKFLCVAHKKDFEKNIEEDALPDNMIVNFDVAPQEYYELMQKAYVVLLPFRDKRVAGLINILKSASFGVPCMISKTASTSQYYCSNSPLLVGECGWQFWAESLKRLLSMERDEYQNLCNEFCDYIQLNFSPQSAAKKIYQICF